VPASEERGAHVQRLLVVEQQAVLMSISGILDWYTFIEVIELGEDNESIKLTNCGRECCVGLIGHKGRSRKQRDRIGWST